MKRQRPYKPKAQGFKRRRTTPYNPPAVAYRQRKRTSSYLEYKATDASWSSNYGATDNPHFITANLIRGDSGINNFEGNKIFPVGLELRLDVYSNSTSVATTMSIRVMIFQWFDSTPPTLAGVLQSTGISSSTISPKLMTNRDNIRILMDKKYILKHSYPTGSAVIDGIVVKKFIKGFKMSEITMASGANTVQKGDIFICFIADTTSLSDKPYFQGVTRLTFTD